MTDGIAADTGVEQPGANELSWRAAQPTTRAERWKLLFPSRAVVLGVLVVCLLLPAALVIQHVRAYHKLSPADEFAHLDYVEKIRRGDIPRLGDRVGPLILRIEACQSIDYRKVVIPPCAAKDPNPDHYPNNGFDHEAVQPPLYYGITAIERALVSKVAWQDDFLANTRVTGFFWLAAGLLLLWAAGRLLGARPWPLLAALLVLVSAPAVVYFSSIVSNDATAVFSGALMLLVVVLVGAEPSRWGTIALFVAGAVAATLKPTNAFAAIAIGLFVLFRPTGASRVQFDRARFLGWLRTGGVLLGGAATAILVWVIVSNSIALVDAKDLPIYAVRRLDEFQPDLLLGQAANLLSAPTGSVPSGLLTGNFVFFTGELTRALFLAVGLSGLFVARRAWYHVLGLASTAALLLGGFGYGLVVWISLTMNPGTGARYGLSILPLLTICLAKLAERGRVALLIGALGAAAAIGTLATLSFA